MVLLQRWDLSEFLSHACATFTTIVVVDFFFHKKSMVAYGSMVAYFFREEKFGGRLLEYGRLFFLAF